MNDDPSRDASPEQSEQDVNSEAAVEQWEREEREREFLNHPNVRSDLQGYYRLVIAEMKGKPEVESEERKSELFAEIYQLKGDLPDSVIDRAIIGDLETLVLFTAMRLIQEAIMMSENLAEMADIVRWRKNRAEIYKRTV